MEQPTKTVSVAALPQVRVLGRTTGTDVVNLFWTGSGIEFIYTGSELQMEVNADYDAYEPWLAVELNGVQISRVPLNKGKNEVCLFRGMTVGKPKHVRILKEVQAMHQDPGHLLQIVGLQYADGEFLQLPEPKYRLEFVGDSITSGEGTVGAVYEEDWISAFFSAENTYPRMVADALSAEYRVISQSGWGYAIILREEFSCLESITNRDTINWILKNEYRRSIMEHLPKRITENGIDYILVGDYYIPDLRLPEESRPIGRWGRMHRDYLKEWRPVLYNDLLLSGRFWTYLADLNEQAQNRLEVITEQMKAASMLPFRNWTKPCCTV